MKLLKALEDQEIIAGILQRAELTTLIKAVCLDKEVDEACAIAKKYHLYSVAAMPTQIPRVIAQLKGSEVQTTCVMDMMGGALVTRPALEITFKDFIDMGVNEFDMMLKIDKLAANDLNAVKERWQHFAEIAHSGGSRLFATIEEGFFDNKTKVLLCKMALEAGVDGIRTCTGCVELCGMNSGRYTFHDICLLRKMLPEEVHIKAGGGTDYGYLEDALQSLECGASYVDIGEQALRQLANMNYLQKEK